MARPRSLTLTLELTKAGKAHDCRFNSKHRFAKGDDRLTVHSDGEEHHYCLPCAAVFISRDIEKLQTLAGQIEQLRLVPR